MTKRELDYHPLTLWNVPDEHHFFRSQAGGLYSYMFIEDLTNYIMPYHTHSSRTNKSYEVIITNPLLEEEIKTLFHMPDWNERFHQPLSEAIFDFIRKATSYLLVKGGRIYFEVVDGTFHHENGSKPVHVLIPIRGKVIRFGSKYYQIIPKETMEMKRRYISVPQSKVWILEIPRALGRLKDVVALSNSFETLEKASYIDSEILMNKINVYGFDVKNFHSTIDALILRVSDRWGWDMRMGINNQHALEYYLYYRMLRFSYSMAILRADMLSKMNNLLARLGYDATMSFSGIPTPDEILDATKKMEQRELSFQEASDLIYFSL